MSVPPEYAAEIDRIAGTLAAQLARREIYWEADKADLRQQVWLLCLEIYRRGKWEDGLNGFCRVARAHSYRRLYLYLVRQKSVVTCGRDSNVPQLIPTLARTVSADSFGAGALGRFAPVLEVADFGQSAATPRGTPQELQEPPAGEAVAAVTHLRAKLAYQVTQAADGGGAVGRASAEVWVNGSTYEVAAERAGVSLGQVADAAKRVHADESVRYLAGELVEAYGQVRYGRNDQIRVA